MDVRVKRVYQPASDNDGFRILVDRVWPRGVSKEKAEVAVWLKDVGPSTDLRKWFNHEPEKWPEFRERYRKELATNPAFKELETLASTNQIVTLVYSAHDEDRNQAVVLKELLDEN